MPVPGGRVTPAPEVPTVLKTCQTPTEGLPGSPTVAVWIVTTPRFAVGRSDEPVLVVLLDDLPPPRHAVAPTETTASRATSASRSIRIDDLEIRCLPEKRFPRPSAWA